MLLSKHWSRIAVGILVLFTFLYVLRATDWAPSLPADFSLTDNPFYGAFVHEVPTPDAPPPPKQDVSQEETPVEDVPSPEAPVDADKPLVISEIQSVTTSATASTSTADVVEHDLTSSIEAQATTVTAGQGTSATTTSSLAETTPNNPPSKAVVMGKTSKEDTTWVDTELTDWQRFVYVVDLPPNTTSPTGLRTHINRSKEAMPYLTYIIDNYPHFADVSVFIHAHRNGWPTAWHNDARNYDAVTMVNTLRLDSVLDRGYINLRCLHEPGCPSEVKVASKAPKREFEELWPYVYASFFDVKYEAVLEQIPVVATPCCAQFAVSRAQILARPLSEYRHMRDYIEASPAADETIGTVMEYMWHIIFGQPPVSCPALNECYATAYGRGLGRGGHRGP